MAEVIVDQLLDSRIEVHVNQAFAQVRLTFPCPEGRATIRLDMESTLRLLPALDNGQEIVDRIMKLVPPEPKQRGFFSRWFR